MQVISKDSKYIFLMEKLISIKKFQQDSEDTATLRMDSEYDRCKVKIIISVPLSVLKTEQFLFEEEPFVIRRVNKDSISLVLRVDKSDLSNSSKKEIKYIKYKSCRKGVFAKSVITVPPMEKKAYMSKEEWDITHPLQGGGISPR